MNRFFAYAILAFALICTGCTGMKGITRTNPLYVGHMVELEGAERDKDKLRRIADHLALPEPNHKTLWMRPALARRNMLSDSARVKKFWKNKIAEPVLLSQVAPEIVSSAMQDRMFHNGYFNARVYFDTVYTSKRKAKLRYHIQLNDPYRYTSIVFPEQNDDLGNAIRALRPASLLKEGDIYTLANVRKERDRINAELKERGFLFFSSDFLLLKADSLTGHNEIHSALTISEATPPESRVPYHIRHVYINDDNVLSNTEMDTIQQDSYFLISEDRELKMEAVLQGLFLKPGELYARSNYLQTLRYLNALPLIRNANAKFIPVEDQNEVDLALYLSHRKRFAYTAEFNTVFRSTNYFGPGMIFSFSDRNAKHGAELLKINLRGSFEMQIVDRKANIAYELGVGASYTLPRFFPGFLANSAKKSLPKTTVSGGYNLFNRIDLYKLNSINLNLGYSWSRTDRISHFLSPLEIIFTSIPEDSKSDKFNEYLEENPGVQRSFDEQFILGAGYEFTIESPEDQQNQFFFRGGIDVAGNVLEFIYNRTNAVKDTLGRYTMFGVPFSQYIRPRFNLSGDFKINQNSRLVTRLSGGVGIPIGNSVSLPYIKQFYVGGTNSLRSFIARSVGPGSEVPPGGYNDITGDIRLEANLEYRFAISGRIKGALFVDAGNVWLFNEDPTRPEGEFRFNTFLNQIAMSAGWGLRWDFDFVVVRLDFGYTIRTPYLPEGERWAQSINIWKPTLNFAIGYPF